MIDFIPLWKTLEEKNFTTYRLLKEYNFSKGTLDSLKHNRNVTLHTIESLCRILEVPIENIVKITFEDSEDTEKQPLSKIFHSDKGY